LLADVPDAASGPDSENVDQFQLLFQFGDIHSRSIKSYDEPGEFVLCNPEPNDLLEVTDCCPVAVVGSDVATTSFWTLCS
jgi:hypothetical protein